jgi:predicted CopG family antitoxin
MSTKTIAIDSQVYARLAAQKREGESFSRLLDRLLTEAAAAHTGSDILRGLAAVAPLSPEDSRTFLTVVAENRKSERWEKRDLR